MTTPFDPSQQGQPPHYPPVGGQPPQYPPGNQPPIPPGIPAYATGAPGPYGTPPKRSRKKLVFIVAGVAVALVIAIVVLALVFTKDNITSIDDAKVGDCITVSGSKDNASAKTANCGADSFNFIVAEQLDSITDRCSGDQYSELTQTDTGKLCLVPNLRTGKCYEFPETSGAITDFKDYDCAEAPESPGLVVVRVTERLESTDVTQCPSGAVSLTYDRPTPLGYCGELQTTR